MAGEGAGKRAAKIRGGEGLAPITFQGNTLRSTLASTPASTPNFRSTLPSTLPGHFLDFPFCLFCSRPPARPHMLFVLSATLVFQRIPAVWSLNLGQR